MQLDAAQLSEYRQLKTQADDKAGRLLQEKAALEAQLKVCCQRRILLRKQGRRPGNACSMQCGASLGGVPGSSDPCLNTLQP